MLDVTKIVGDYVAVWNEANPAHRRHRIEALWVPDGTTCYRLLDAHGYDAIESRVAGSWDKWLRDGQYFFRPKASICHHDVIKCTWEMLTVPNNTVAANGLSFLVLDRQGRIRDDFQFNPSLNDGGTLIDRCCAAASEPEAARRNCLIAELWAVDGIYATDRSASQGHAEIDAAIAAAAADWAAQGLTPAPAVRSQAHHHVAWFQSVLQAREGHRIGGTVSHLLILGADGRIGCDYAFEDAA
jgi:hypothetical protein